MRANIKIPQKIHKILKIGWNSCTKIDKKYKNATIIFILYILLAYILNIYTLDLNFFGCLVITHVCVKFIN